MSLRIIQLITALLVSFAASNASSANKNPPSSTGQQASGPSRIRISQNVAGTQLINKVAPVYPAAAKLARVSGTVTLHVVTGTDGVVQRVEFISGPQLLVASAMDAVKQWRYKPTLLNGQPVEIDTTVVLDFDLSKETSTNERITSEVDPQFREDVAKLFQLAIYRQSSERDAIPEVVSILIHTAPSFDDLPNKDALLDAYRNKLLSILESSELTDRISEVYAKYLSDDDIKSLTLFLESPAGQHFRAAELDLDNGVAQAAIQLAHEQIPEINKEFCREHPELQGKTPICSSQAGNDASH
jgi:TonB family protein